VNRARSLAQANSIALLAPTALLGGALWFQYFGGLAPCEMCHWQRWPHMVAIGLALLALALRRSPARLVLLALAGLAILISGGLGVFHAGVEQHWWQGVTRCAMTGSLGATPGDFLKSVMAQPLVRCDSIPWSLFGLSMAAWNAVLSGVSGGLVLLLTARK
jgi:disulfide bond formation protein DsbB